MKLARDLKFDQNDLEKLREQIYNYCQNNNDIDFDDVKNRIDEPKNGKDLNNNIDNDNGDNGDQQKVQDWMLKRLWLAGHRNSDEAFEKFLEFFRLRTEFNVSKLTLSNTMPAELFQMDALQKCGVDKQNNQVFVLRLKYYKKIQQLDWLLKRAIFYQIEQYDLQYEHKQIDGLCIVIDCQDFSLTNVDLNILKFVVKQIPFGYFGLVRMVIVYELSYLLTYIIKIVESWIPTYIDKNGNKQKFFSIANKKNIDDFIDVDQRPENLNGTLNTSNNNNIKIDNNKIQPFNEFCKQFDECHLKASNIAKIDQHINYLMKQLEETK